MKYEKLKFNGIHGSHPGILKQIHKTNTMVDNDLKSINKRFMGAGMSQSYSAIYWFEHYIECNRFEYIVELGSQKGALSTYLANMAAITEQFYFDTVELFPDNDWYKREHEGAGHWFKKISEISDFINYFHDDIFGDSIKNHIKENINDKRTFIFCDGGNKKREFMEYAPLLKSGDCIALHDFGVEFTFDDEMYSFSNIHNMNIDIVMFDSANNYKTTILPFIKK